MVDKGKGNKPSKSGNAQKDTGAGSAMAARSKDAKGTEKAANIPKEAKKSS